MEKKREEFELKEDDFAAWDTRDEVTLSAAACIMLNFQPYRDSYPANEKAQIVTMEKSLKEAIKKGDLKQVSDGPKVSMSDLRKWAQAKKIYPLALFPEKRKKLSFKHSPDFRSIALYDGTVFTLSLQQAQVIDLLASVYQHGTPDLSGEDIFDHLGRSARSERNLKKAVFKKDPEIYEALIESKRKGTYRLKT